VEPSEFSSLMCTGVAGLAGAEEELDAPPEVTVLLPPPGAVTVTTVFGEPDEQAARTSATAARSSDAMPVDREREPLCTPLP
jgi:hypothetical protein